MGSGKGVQREGVNPWKGGVLRRCSECRGVAQWRSNEVGVERGLLCLARVWSDGEHSEEARRMIVLYKGKGLLCGECSFVKSGG